MSNFKIVQGTILLTDRYGNIVGTKNINGDLDEQSAQLKRVATASAIEAVLDDVATTSGTEDLPGFLRMTPKRALHVTMHDTNGGPFGVSGNPIYVNCTPIWGFPGASTIWKNYEDSSMVRRDETDMPTMSYTVTAGKTFVLQFFGANYDTQSPMYVRLKKQTGGTGPFNLIHRLTLKQHGQDESNAFSPLGHGLKIGSGGDVIKVTYETALAKGKLWAAFGGVEY